MPASPPWLTASQAAARLQVSAKTVTRWANQGRLQHRRTWAAIAASTRS
jgi:predicted site-specific integrase-resolvase